jgi:modulator of drug activity B
MNVLLINGAEVWPNSQGKLNESLLLLAENYFQKIGCQVQITRVAEPWHPTEEVEKVIQANLILYFTPVFWMSIPSSFKEYLDKVFSGGRGRIYAHDGREQGGSYGSAGLLKGSYSLITTFNAPLEAFDKEGFFEGKTVDDLFFPFHKAQQFVGLKMTKSFSLHNVKKVTDWPQWKNDFLVHLHHISNP